MRVEGRRATTNKQARTAGRQTSELVCVVQGQIFAFNVRARLFATGDGGGEGDRRRRKEFGDRTWGRRRSALCVLFPCPPPPVFLSLSPSSALMKILSAHPFLFGDTLAPPIFLFSIGFFLFMPKRFFNPLIFLPSLTLYSSAASLPFFV